jgi:hypothetical protein
MGKVGLPGDKIVDAFMAVWIHDFTEGFKLLRILSRNFVLNQGFFYVL